MSKALDRFQGSPGFVVTSSTGMAQTGAFWAITMLADTTFSAIGGNFTGTLSGVTIPAGITIFGEFEGYTVGTGKVIAYNSLT